MNEDLGVQIPDMPPAGEFMDDDLYEVVQGGVSRKMSGALIKAAMTSVAQAEIEAGLEDILESLAGSKSVTSIREVAAASATLQKSDAGGVVEISSESANTVIVPAETGDPLLDFAYKNVVTVVQAGAGTTTIQAASGVTIHAKGLVLNGTNAAVQLVYYGNDTWRMFGDLVTATVD